MNSHAYFTRRLLQLPVVFMEAPGLSTETVQLCCPSCSETVKKCNTNHFTSTIKIVPLAAALRHNFYYESKASPFLEKFLCCIFFQEFNMPSFS